MADSTAPPTMGGTELRECMDSASWNTEAMSRALDLNRVTVQRWLRDIKPVPAEVAAHMRMVAAWHREHPFVRAERHDDGLATGCRVRHTSDDRILGEVQDFEFPGNGGRVFVRTTEGPGYWFEPWQVVKEHA